VAPGRVRSHRAAGTRPGLVLADVRAWLPPGWATPLPRPQPRHRMDPAKPGRHARQPQIHRLHGLRAAPHPQRLPHPRSPRPVALVTSPRPPRHHRPGHLGPRPDRGSRARLQPGRGRPEHPPRHRPVLPLPGPGPVPGLPAPHGREHLRQAHVPVVLLPVPAQLDKPQARRRPPRPPPGQSRPPNCC
jgi:hypothetical protein